MTRVWITRDEPPDGPLSAALEAVGLRPVCEPVIRRVPERGALAARDTLADDDWLLLTSPYAVELVAEHPRSRVPRVAVVGNASRQLAEQLGLRVALVSPDGHGGALRQLLRERVAAGTLCYPRSGRAAELPSWAAVQIISPVLYQTRSREFDRGVLQHVDIVSYASPSAVQAVGRVLLPTASIGRSTSAALRTLDLPVTIEAAEATFAGLAAAIADYTSPPRNQRA